MTNTTLSTDTDYTSILQKRLSDKIKSNFIELIPEEQFDEMVKNAMDELVNGPKNKRFENKSVWDGNRYVNRPEPIFGYNVLLDNSTIPGMIYAELHSKAKKAVIEIMARPEYSNAHSTEGFQDAIETGIAKVVTENPDVFMKSLISGIIRSAMANTLQALRSGNNGVGVY